MGLSIALVSPQIPPNTGTISRLAVATGAALHLIRPLGFSLDDVSLRRAGLDYWDEVDLWTHDNLPDFHRAIDRTRCLYFSAHGTRSYIEAPYRENSVLVFGSETRGVPEEILSEHPERVFRIPMRPGVRNINLAISVGVVTYEAIRSLSLDLET